MAISAAHLADIGALPTVEPVVLLGGGEEIGDGGVGGERMLQEIELGRLLAARLGAAGLQHDVGVPMQNAAYVGKQADAPEARGEIVIGAHTARPGFSRTRRMVITSTAPASANQVMAYCR